MMIDDYQMIMIDDYQKQLDTNYPFRGTNGLEEFSDAPLLQGLENLKIFKDEPTKPRLAYLWRTPS